MSVRAAFPSTPRDIACMCACYLLTAALAAAAVAPSACANFLTGVLP